MGRSPEFNEEIAKGLHAKELARRGQERGHKEIVARQAPIDRAAWQRARDMQALLAAERARQQAMAEAEAERQAAAYAEIAQRLHTDSTQTVAFLRKNHLKPPERFISGQPRKAEARRRRFGNMIVDASTAYSGSNKGWVLGRTVNHRVHSRWISLGGVQVDYREDREVKTNMIQVSGVALGVDGQLYAFDSGEQPEISTLKAECGEWHKKVATPLSYYQTEAITAPLLLQYGSAYEMIHTCPIVNKGEAAFSIDDQGAVDSLLTDWHKTLVDFATNVAWDAGIRPE